MTDNQPQRHYRKSARSGGSGGNCVEWAHTPDGVYIRDSKDPNGPELLATPSEWSTLLIAAAANGTHPWLTYEPTAVCLRKDGHQLTFTSAEWTAFQAGIAAGECVGVYVSV